VLNSAAEHELLVQILAAWALPAESPGAAAANIPRLADAHNWRRDETDATVEPATSILAIAITDKGRKKLARAAHPSRSSFWPWHKRRSSDR
jgi:hypothetical protein